MGFTMQHLDGALRSISQTISSTKLSISESLQKIASGRNFQKASENPSGFTEQVILGSKRAAYTTIKRDIERAGIYVNTMIRVADSIMNDLRKAGELFAGGNDEAAVEVIKNIEKTVQSTMDGVDLVKPNYGEITSVSNNTINLDLSDMSVATGTESSAQDVSDSIENMNEYIDRLIGLKQMLQSQHHFTEIYLLNVDAKIDLINEIDEAEEIARMLDEQIRLQTAVSMLAQANISRRRIASLYNVNGAGNIDYNGQNGADVTPDISV